MRRLILIILTAFPLAIFAQNRTYSTYRNVSGLFSFECPNTWISLIDSSSLSDNESNELNNRELPLEEFVSNKKEEADIYRNCYDGIIFYLEVNDKSLDSTLLSNNLYIKKEGDYFGTFAFMSNELVPTEKINGHNWFGIHHFNSCSISCKEGNSAIVEECEFLYLSNNKYTVSISTTGKAIDPDVLKVILSTFKFKE